MAKVFNLSEAASIGIHSIVLIAKSEERINVTNISEILDFSKHHVAKVLQRLVKVGLLKSNRGPSGGFVLNKEPENVTLLEVFEAIEGKMHDTDCAMGYNDCPFDDCILGSIVHDMNQNFKEYLENKTIKHYIEKES